MPSYKTAYKSTWELDPIFSKWIQPVKENCYEAWCTHCRCKIFLSNMGRQALVSHSKGKKHQSNQSAGNRSMALQAFWKSTSEQSSTLPATRTTTSVPSPSTGPSPSTPQLPSTSTAPDRTQILPPELVLQQHSLALPKPSPRGLDNFLLKEEVTKAEILWCIETVMTHKSLRTAEKDIDTLKKMCSDSQVVTKIQLKKDKIAYTIMYGIAVFFNDALRQNLNSCEFFTVGFDESLNKIVKRQQMDINVRFWDDEKNEVVTRYLTSCFLGRSRASDLLAAFKEGISGLKTNKLLQISMDGPNVNWAFLREIKKQLTERELLELGSCGLHSVHGAFKDGIIATN